MRDLQGEQTRNRRSRRRCDFAVPDRTPASGCAEGSSQLVCKSVNRQVLLISLSGDSSQFAQSHTNAQRSLARFFVSLDSTRSHVAPSCRQITVKGFPSPPLIFTPRMIMYSILFLYTALLYKAESSKKKRERKTDIH